MATTKFSNFTLQSIANIIASPQSSYFYLVGHNEFSNENIKIPFTDFINFIGSSLGAIVELGEITDDDTYTIVTDPQDYDGYTNEKVFVFISGQEGYTSVQATVDLAQATITFPYTMYGTSKIRIVMFK